MSLEEVYTDAKGQLPTLTIPTLNVGEHIHFPDF